MLDGPEPHNNFYLIDVTPCVGSDFQVLGPKDPETGMHCPGFRLNETTQAIIDAVCAESGCTPGVYCEGKGYAGTIKGEVKEPGDGSDTRQGPPLLTDIQVLNRSVGCDGADTVPPLCGGAVPGAAPEPLPAPDGPESEPEPAPVPELEPVPTPAPGPDAEPDTEPDEEPSGASLAQVCLGSLVVVASAFLSII